MNTLIVRTLDQAAYLPCWERMQAFTHTRQADTVDEVWLLEHSPVYTQGQNGKAEHILQASDIPVVQTDRGGQITYHGPGQLMVYTLIDLKRKKWHVRQFVNLLEQSVIDFLAADGITAYAKCKAPGVYVAEKKICSIGLRIRKGCSYHGIALNVTTDLTPFSLINPCGFSGLQMTRLADIRPNTAQNMQETARKLIPHLTNNLGYTKADFLNI